MSRVFGSVAARGRDSGHHQGGSGPGERVVRPLTLSQGAIGATRQRSAGRRSMTNQTRNNRGLHCVSAALCNRQRLGIADVASDRHPAKPQSSIDSTDDGRVTEARSEHPKKALHADRFQALSEHHHRQRCAFPKTNTRRLTCSPVRSTLSSGRCTCGRRIKRPSSGPQARPPSERNLEKRVPRST
jgi:hypothetical protein